MNRIGIISVQLDKPLRSAVEKRRKEMTTALGRDVRDAELVRVLLRQGLGDRSPPFEAGYVEGWRAGAAAAKEAHARAVDAAQKRGQPVMSSQ